MSDQMNWTGPSDTDYELEVEIPSEHPRPSGSTAVLASALRKVLEEYDGACTKVQRREIGLQLGFDPGTVFGALSRRGLIAEPVPPGRDPSLRIVTESGRQWLASPDAYGGASYGAFVARVSGELGKRAQTAGLATDPRWPHVLADQNAWTTALWAPLRAHADGWVPAADRHRWIHNLRSSQAFAVNMFGPLRLGRSWARKLWQAQLPDVTSVEFEWPKNDDPLHETAVRGSRTRVDVRVDYSNRSTAIIEVKLTEADFGACSSADKKRNPYWADSCDVAFSTFERLASTCYLAREAKRDYFVRLGRVSSQVDPALLALHGTSGCPLRGGLYQIVRNLMMAQHVTEHEGRSSRVLVLAPGPQLHPMLHSHEGELTLRDHLRSILKPDRHDEIDVIAFDELVESAKALGEEAHSWADHMIHWYVEPLRYGANTIR